jgi:bifunctional N-acetylglucosamine-1-phosphate-uridyltransferase/glucosamine-1-phosphate-acetyltransferase GlmU-like protein
MLIIVAISGIGQRFIDAGYSTPKPLIKVTNEKTIIEFVINQFSINGNFSEDDKFYFVCSNTILNDTNIKELLTKLVPNSRFFGIEQHKLGPVYSISKIFNELEELNDIIVSYCDYGTIWDYNKFKNYIKNGNFDGVIPYYTGFHPHMLGTDHYAYALDELVQINGEYKNILLEINEKTPYKKNKLEEKSSNGCYYFKNTSIIKKYFIELMDNNISIKGEYYVSLVYNLMVKNRLTVGLFEIDKMLQFGTPKDLRDYQKWYDLRYYMNSKENKNTTLILPMAGYGSRFNMFNYPKPLLDINNKPMFVQAVLDLPITTKKIFICREEHEKQYNISNIVNTHFGKDSEVEVHTLKEVTDGQACTVNTIRSDELYNNSILISACDNGIIYSKDVFEYLKNDPDIDVIIFGFKNNQSANKNPEMYAWLELEENNTIKKVHCKIYPFNDEPSNHYAIVGTMYFKKGKYFFDNYDELIKKNIKVNGEFYVDSVINECINNKLNVKLIQTSYICWGTSNDYLTYKYWNELFTK